MQVSSLTVDHLSTEECLSTSCEIYSLSCLLHTPALQLGLLEQDDLTMNGHRASDLFGGKKRLQDRSVVRSEFGRLFFSQIYAFHGFMHLLKKASIILMSLVAIVILS